jgi:hypothetical protein
VKPLPLRLVVRASDAEPEAPDLSVASDTFGLPDMELRFEGPAEALLLDPGVRETLSALGPRRALSFRYDRGLAAVSWLEAAPASPDVLRPAIDLVVGACRLRHAPGGYR